jgi:hypothetical protein
MDIPRTETESNIIYQYRVNYIETNVGKHDMLTLIKNSKILANMKFKKCKYEPKIYNELKLFL